MRHLVLCALSVLAVGCSSLSTTTDEATQVIDAAEAPELMADAPPIEDVSNPDRSNASDSIDGTTEVAAVLTERLEIRLVEDIDPGYLRASGIELEYPREAMRWAVVSAFDPDSGHWYSASDGVAEPGDGGCWEMLIPATDADIMMRSSQDRSPTFVSTGEGLDDGPEVEKSGPLGVLSVAELAAVVGELDAAIADPDVAGRRTIDLDGVALGRLIGMIASLGGETPRLDTGVLGFAADDQGRLTHLDVRAEGLDEPVAGRDPRHRTYALDVDFVHGGTEFAGVTDSTSRRTAGGCIDRSTDVVGTWRLARGDWGDASGVPTLELIGESEARLTILADGTVTGTTGCRSFTGSATLETTWLGDVELSVEGDPCTDEMARLRGDGLLGVLDGDPGFLAFEDGIALHTESGLITLVPSD